MALLKQHQELNMPHTNYKNVVHFHLLARILFQKMKTFFHNSFVDFFLCAAGLDVLSAGYSVLAVVL